MIFGSTRKFIKLGKLNSEVCFFFSLSLSFLMKRIEKVSLVGFNERYLWVSSTDPVSRVNAAVTFLPAPLSYTGGPYIS